MDIKKIARKPELVEVVIDDQDIVENYGEPITFWMREFVDLNTYFEYFRSQSEHQGDALTEILRKVILNKEGKPALGKDDELPVDISLAAIGKMNDVLGKSKPRSSTQKVGQQPS